MLICSWISPIILESYLNRKCMKYERQRESCKYKPAPAPARNKKMMETIETSYNRILVT